jgi:hypothetical protein
MLAGRTSLRRGGIAGGMQSGENGFVGKPAPATAHLSVDGELIAIPHLVRFADARTPLTQTAASTSPRGKLIEAALGPRASIQARISS